MDSQKIYTIENQEKIKRVKDKDILFITIDTGVATFHLNDNDKLYCCKSLKKLLMELPNSFCVIYRNSIVNINNIYEVNKKKKTAILSDGKELKISSRKYKYLIEHLKNY